MSEHIFDTFTRHAAAAVSRRGIVLAIAGLALGGSWGSVLNTDDADAKKKRKKKRKKKNKKRQGATAPPAITCTRNCAGKVCDVDGCGGSCGACSPTELCAQGQCVIGLGTCNVGDDICDDFDYVCDIGVDCVCWTSTSNQTRCGFRHALLNLPEPYCTNDDQCAVLFPDTPGAFCVGPTGELCAGVGGHCYAPCIAV